MIASPGIQVATGGTGGSATLHANFAARSFVRAVSVLAILGLRRGALPSGVALSRHHRMDLSATLLPTPTSHSDGIAWWPTTHTGLFFSLGIVTGRMGASLPPEDSQWLAEASIDGRNAGASSSPTPLVGMSWYAAAIMCRKGVVGWRMRSGTRLCVYDYEIPTQLSTSSRPALHMGLCTWPSTDSLTRCLRSPRKFYFSSRFRGHPCCSNEGARKLQRLKSGTKPNGDSDIMQSKTVVSSAPTDWVFPIMLVLDASDPRRFCVWPIRQITSQQGREPLSLSTRRRRPSGIGYACFQPCRAPTSRRA